MRDATTTASRGRSRGVHRKRELVPARLDRDALYRRCEVRRGKATGYDEFYRSGAFAERCGGKREHAADLLEELARPTGTGALIHDQFWATTWDEILSDPLGPIYLHVGDYAAATAGTMCDPARFVTSQRARDRDELICERAVKRRLVGQRGEKGWVRRDFPPRLLLPFVHPVESVI